MILWCDGAHGARENMRRDSSLLARLAAHREGSGEAVLRLFGFAPPGITLGRAQSPERWLDLERCRADGVEWAVRPTGGRATFHADEWTYSLIARIDDPHWGGSLHASCARACGVIHAALSALGIPATLSQSGPRRGGSAVTTAAAAPPEPADPGAATRPSCFAATARHELSLAGRKLAGSAQRRTATALLQQGSILLGDGHLRLADYLALDDGARDAARRALARHAAPAGAYLRDGWEVERLAGAIGGVLGEGARRISGDEGVFLLTPEDSGSYTATFSN